MEHALRPPLIRNSYQQALATHPLPRANTPSAYTTLPPVQPIRASKQPISVGLDYDYYHLDPSGHLSLPRFRVSVPPTIRYLSATLTAASVKPKAPGSGSGTVIPNSIQQKPRQPVR